MATALDAKYYKINIVFNKRHEGELTRSFELASWEYYRDFLIVKHGNRRFIFKLEEIEAFQTIFIPQGPAGQTTGNAAKVPYIPETSGLKVGETVMIDENHE